MAILDVGDLNVRPSTLRAVFMDLAGEIGDQGFRWAFVVHVHGSPMHIRAIDDAGDFFHDTCGGRMVNLWGLVPVIAGWGDAMTSLGDARIASAAVDRSVKLLEGADPSAIQRYGDLLFRNPVYQERWIQPATARDETRGAAEREWLSRRRP